MIEYPDYHHAMLILVIKVINLVPRGLLHHPFLSTTPHRCTYKNKTIEYSCLKYVFAKPLGYQTTSNNMNIHQIYIHHSDFNIPNQTYRVVFDDQGSNLHTSGPSNSTIVFLKIGKMTSKLRS